MNNNLRMAQDNSYKLGYQPFYTDNTVKCGDNTCPQNPKGLTIQSLENVVSADNDLLVVIIDNASCLEEVFLTYQVRCFSKGETSRPRVRRISVRFRRGSLRDGYYI